MNRRNSVCRACHFLAGVALLVVGGTGRAGIVSTSGAVTEVPSPASVLEGALESSTVAHAFPERTNLVLLADLPVNFTAPGTYTSPIDPSDSILGGTVVESYFFHMDVVGGIGAPSFSYVGSATFDSDILGVVTSESKLDTTDPILGLGSVVYPTGVAGHDRGSLDTPGALDTITLSADRRTISFDLLHGDNKIEQFRVITAVIPEPSTLVLLSAGVGLVLACAARRRIR